MQAIVMDGPGDESVLRLAEVPEPAAGVGQLLIRVAATAVNRADLIQRQGAYPPPPGAPDILGLECAGTVAAVGEGVAGWRVGDRVMALLPGGGYAEYVSVDAGSALRVPERLSLEEAAATPEVFLTASLNLFQLGRLSEGGAALVHGGGSGVGTAAIQLIAAAGARAFVTAGSAEKCQRCLELGAERAIDYKRESFAEVVRDATGGRGVDVVLDSIGAPYLEANLSSLATGGRLVLIGLMGGAKAEIGLGPVLMRRLQILGSTLRARPLEEKAEIVRIFVTRFGAHLESGRIGPIVDRVLPLADAAEAHRVMQSSAHFGKIVLQVGG